MTYPSQPAYAPQGYAPQQPYGQQYPSYPQVPQQHATPQQGGQGVPTAAPALGTSSRSGEAGPRFPQPRHLIGRTVIFEPIRVDEDATAQVFDQATRQTVTVKRPMAYYHMTVVDGGSLEYGDNKSQKIDEQHGFTMRTEVPARFVSCSSDRWGIVQEIRDAMARGELATVGVIVQGTKGTKGSPPFLVTRPGLDLDGKERPDGDQRFQLATAVWNDVFAKTFRSPEPVSLVAPPAQQPPQVAYQPTPAGYAAAQQPIAQPYPYGGAAQPPAQQPPVDPAYAAWLASQQPAPVPQSAPPVDPQYAAWLASQQAQPSQGGPGF